MKRIIVLILLLALTNVVYAETAPDEAWNKTFGGDSTERGWSVQQTSDGGYILVGDTRSYGAGGSDFWLVKTDSNGNKEWDKTFGGTGLEWACSVQQTSDGGYVLAGRTDSYGAGGGDFWLVKTDSNGNKVWDKTFGGTNSDSAHSVQQTSDGGYILAGDTGSYGAGNGDFWLVKTDSNGNKEWDKTFGGNSIDWAYSVQQTSDCGYILAGHTYSYGAGDEDFWLIKTDSEGNKEWDKTFGGTNGDRARSVQQTSDDGYILAGDTESYGVGSWDFWLVKTDSEGNKVWDKTFGGTATDWAYSVQQTSDSGYILAGATMSYGAGNFDFWLVKTDSNGNKEWDKTFGGTNDDRAESVRQTSDGGYILAGSMALFSAGPGYAWLIKVGGVHTSTPTPTSDIRVWSSPSGARIYLDGVYQGVTGSDWFWIYDVSTGYHTIYLEDFGYGDYTETVYVSAGDTASVSAYLTATPSPTTVVTSTPVPTGSIRVWSSPSGADIYLDGVYQGLTGSNWFWIYEVSAGYHTIRLEKSRYEDYTETVYVSAGTTSVSDAGSVYACHAASVYATLTQEADSISVSSTPSGADIYLDGVYKGTTPTTISDASPGSHTLKLEKYGYDEWLTSVHVTSGVTESITGHLTAADVSSPAIRIDKPAIIEYNNNELLEEGEKVTIIYGANDPSGVASIKILLDGAMLESQNQAGTYTVTTNSLTTGKHVIRVEATDSKSNSCFEELPITVERTGPSVYFGTTRTAIKKGEDAIFTLSAVNPIGNPSMTIQLILKPPSGVSVTSSSFAKAGSGIYTCTQVIESGDNVRSIEVRLTGNEVGTHEIESEVYYQFRGSPKSPTRYDMLTLIVEQDPRSADSESEARELVVPGFGAMVAVMGLLAVYLWRKRR